MVNTTDTPTDRHHLAALRLLDIDLARRGEDTVELLPVRPHHEPLAKNPVHAPRNQHHDTDPPDDPAPRGRRHDGTIRTTGWLQLGSHPVSSGLWATLTGAIPGFALIHVCAWLALILPTAAYALWRVTTRRLLPASTAVNRDRRRADQLRPGTAVRLHGPIGPVGVITHLTRVADDRVLIGFDGGGTRLLPADAECHVVELRD